MSLIWLWPALLCFSDTAVNMEESLFAIVTNKDGFAKGLAHDHLIHAGEMDISFTFPEQAKDLRISFQFPVSGLVVDEPAKGERWFPVLSSLGFIKAPFSKLEMKDRDKIRGHMLGHKQLHGDKHPQVLAELRNIRAEPSKVGEKTFSHQLEVSITVRGQTITRWIAGSVTLENDMLVLEAAATYAFTDFGIKPYSAMLGAVSNQDQFGLYVYLRSEKE